MPSAKQYKAIRPFVRTNPKTGADTAYSVGDVYPGPFDKDYLTSADGPDGWGALIAEVALPETSAPSASPASDSTKEK